jgi:hypothetical protein
MYSIDQIKTKINWAMLSGNPEPEAIELLAAHEDKINWWILSGNPAPEAIELLAAHEDKIDWMKLSGNPAPEAIELLAAHEDKIDWTTLSGNPAAIKLVAAHEDEIDWYELSGNPAPEALELLKGNKDEINYLRLAGNTAPEAIELLAAHDGYVDWSELSRSLAPEAIELVAAHEDEIDWYELSGNPAPGAIELLKKNQDKIDWESLSANPAPEALELLLANPEILEIINWEYLSGNPAPEALELLAAHEDKIDWWALSGNPKLFELVEMLRQNELLEAMQINCLYNDATRRCRIRRDGVQENDYRCIYQNNRCVISERGQRIDIRDTVTTLVEEARLGMVPDRMVDGYYTYGEVDLDVTEKMHDIIKLFNDTRTYASANHIAIRPGLPDIFNIFITDMRNFILYIPTLREQLRDKPLGAIGLFGPLGQLRGRYDLEQGTQYYILNLTTTVIFDKVLHTENARDFGDPEDFPAFIMNMVETCFDNLYGYLFKTDGNLMTNVDSINVVLSNWTELLTSIPGGACLENILNTWIEMFQGPVIDLRIHQNETKAENLTRILNSIRNHLCKTSINLNSNRRIYGDMSLEEKIPLGISYIVNVLDGPNPWEEGDYTIPEGLVEILVSNNIIGAQVSDGTIEPEDLIEQLKGIGPPWGGVPYELVGEEDMNDIRERCVETGYWR